MSIKQLDNLHTSEALATAVHDCLTDWHITDSKVMMVITDNCSNVLKAVRLLSEKANATEGSESDSESESGENSSSRDDGEDNTEDNAAEPADDDGDLDEQDQDDGENDKSHAVGVRFRHVVY